jgi:hypothetical protein
MLCAIAAFQRQAYPLCVNSGHSAIPENSVGWR